jgi:hypothetical protein
VGQCGYESPEASNFKYAEPDFAVLMARTQASLNGRGGLLRIEQHCYLRHGEDAPAQTWVAPHLLLEPAATSRLELEALARQMHERYVAEARRQAGERLLI